MTEAAGSADLAPAERLHPLILLTGLGGSIRGVAGGYAGIGYLAATGNLRTALIAAALLLAGLLVSLTLYWRRFEYRVGSHEIRIDSGILNRNHRSIPFDRVQDVDIEQGPLARLLGLAKVKFETGGSAAGGREEGILPAIALSRAEELRELVRARRGVAVPAEVGVEVTAPLYAMNLKRLLTAGVFNFSLAVFAGLFGLTQTAGDLIGFDPFKRTFWERLLISAGPVSAFVETHRIGAAIAGIALLALLGFGTGIIRTTLREFRFRLDRTGTGLRRRRGLFTLTDVTLPLRRIQAALILTGPVREALGWKQLKLQSLARDEAGSGDHVVAPLATDEEVAGIVAEIGWLPPTPSAAWEGVSRAYVFMLVIALAPLLLILGALSLLLAALPFLLDEGAATLARTAFAPALMPALLMLSAILSAIFVRWMSWRRTGFMLREDALLIRTGWWRRRMVLLPLASVQSVDLAHSFLSRRFEVARLTIGVAGGSGFAGHSIPALPFERASQLRQALLSRFA